jgi:hypothetical protein
MAFDNSASALRVLAPTSAPTQPFLRWAVATDPAAWDAEVGDRGPTVALFHELLANFANDADRD